MSKKKDLSRLSLGELAALVRSNLLTLEAGDKLRRETIMENAHACSHAKRRSRDEGKSWAEWSGVTAGLHVRNADDYVVIWQAWSKRDLRLRPLLGESIDESARRARKALKLGRAPTRSEMSYGTDDVSGAVTLIANHFRGFLRSGVLKKHIREALPVLIKDMKHDDFVELDAALRDMIRQVSRIRKGLSDAQQKSKRTRKFIGLPEPAK